MKTGDVKAKFDKYYSEWKGYIQKPEIMVSSNTSDYINCDAYEKIVDLGKPALPYIMEKLAKGDFFLNEAAHRITKIDIIPKGQPLASEQEEARFWLEWWEKNKNTQLEE